MNDKPKPRPPMKAKVYGPLLILKWAKDAWSHDPDIMAWIRRMELK